MGWRQNDRKKEGLVSATPWGVSRVKAGFCSPTVRMKKVWLRKRKGAGPRSHRAGTGLNKSALRPTCWIHILVPKWQIPGLRKGKHRWVGDIFFSQKAKKCSKTAGVCQKDPGANLKRHLPATYKTIPASVRIIYPASLKGTIQFNPSWWGKTLLSRRMQAK